MFSSTAIRGAGIDVRDDLADRRKIEAALAKAERVLAERQRIVRIQAETRRVEGLIRQRKAGA